MILIEITANLIEKYPFIKLRWTKTPVASNGLRKINIFRINNAEKLAVIGSQIIERKREQKALLKPEKFIVSCLTFLAGYMII